MKPITEDCWFIVNSLNSKFTYSDDTRSLVFINEAGCKCKIKAPKGKKLRFKCEDGIFKYTVISSQGIKT